MRKIISLYQRNYDGDRLVRDEVVPGAEWVLAGEGVATRKYDGTCCMMKQGRLFKRYDLKPGKMAPANFEIVQHDKVTGKSFGWVPVGQGPEDKWYREALEDGLTDGTYELVGPKVQGNPEKFDHHTLIPHTHAEILNEVPREFDRIKWWLSTHDIEGVVWHHEDGRMVKIKGRDFGLRRNGR